MLSDYKMLDDFDNLRKLSDDIPLKRENKSVINYLEEVFYKEYISEIEKIDCMKDDLKNIIYFCNSLVKTIQYFNEGKMLKSYEQFYSAMDEIKESLYYTNIEQYDILDGRYDGYYRVRKCPTITGKYPALEMLHLKFDLRYLASSNRYSLPGNLCTYFSLQDSLAWIESDKPDKFCLMKCSIQNSEKGIHKILNINYDLEYIFGPYLYNVYPPKKVLKTRKNVCYTIPLMAACSFVCNDKHTVFNEEYVIPQMLMSWIKERDDINNCVGVKYYSSSFYECAMKHYGYNIAMPIIEPGADGYCNKLQQIFDLKNAEVKYYDTCCRSELPWSINNLLGSTDYSYWYI